MTTSELLKEAAIKLEHTALGIKYGNTAGFEHYLTEDSMKDLADQLRQEADRLDGIKIVAETPDSAKGITIGQGSGKPKPAKIKEFYAENMYKIANGYYTLYGISVNELKTFNTLIRDYNERNGL